MRTLWPQFAAWLDQREPFALATVTAISGSAPRAPGSCMAIMPGPQRFLGSVSSGCLDMEVVEAAHKALATGTAQDLRFGPDGQPPWSDGLTCGGWISVRVEPWWGAHARTEVRAIVPLVRTWLERDEPGVVISRGESHLACRTGQDAIGDRAAFSAAEVEGALACLAAGLPPALVPTERGELLVRTIRPRPRLVLTGAPDVAIHLVALARETGFATHVIDPRTAYLDETRFSAKPDRIIRAWPQAAIPDLKLGLRDVGVAITHDPKIDDVALLALLNSEVGYIGAMGSTRSHAARLERLKSHGVTSESLARIHGPAGIHLGTPHAAGIATGILAGVLRWQAEDERLRAASSS